MSDIIEDQIFDRMKAFVEADSYISYSDVSASEFGRDPFYFYRKFNPLDEPTAYVEKQQNHEMRMQPIIGTGLHYEWEQFSKKHYPDEQAEVKITEEFEGLKVGGTVDNIMHIDGKKYVFDLKTKQALGYNSFYNKKYNPDDPLSVEKYGMMIWQLSLNRWLQRDKDIEPIGYIGVLGYCLWKDKHTKEYPVPIHIIELPLKSYAEVEERLREIVKAKTIQPELHCGGKQGTYCDLVCYSNKRLKYGDIEL